MDPSNNIGKKRKYGEISKDDDDVDMVNQSSPPPEDKVNIDNIDDTPFSEDEAMEDNLIDDNGAADEEEAGEDLMENADDDYKAIPELDKYEDKGMDNQSYDSMGAADRLAVD